MTSARLLLLSPLLLLGLAACGDDDKAAEPSGDSAKSYADTPIDQIGEDATKAMKDLKAVHLTGNVKDDGKEMVIDLTISEDRCKGTVGMEDAGSAQIISTGGVTYFKADEAFWLSQGGKEAGGVIMGLVGDKWAIDSSDPDGFGQVCDLHEMLSDLDSGDISDDGSKVVGTEDVDGESAVKISFTSDDDNPGHAYIASDAPHYILKMDVPGEGTMLFNEFDQDVDVQKPADSDVFDLAELSKRAG